MSPCRRTRSKSRKSGPFRESHRHHGPELLSSGRGLPVGLSGPHERPRIHPADRPGAVHGRLHVEPGVERVPGDPRAHLRPPLRAGLPAHPDRRGPGRHLPPEARRVRPARRHRRSPPGDPVAQERPARRLRRRRPGLAHGRQRPPAARLRGGHPRAARQARRPDAHQHPRVPPAGRGPRRGDRDDPRHGRRISG